jgi:carboxymethylenebutenolidase
MATKVDFVAKSGAPVSGELAVPEGTGTAPAIVLLQEYWGLNDHIRSLADRFAKEGFLTLAPDLYHGKITKKADEAMKLMQELDGKQAMDDIAGAVAFLASHARSNGKVGVTGFCMGGAYALAAASAIPSLGAVVSFYGIPPAERLDFTAMKMPILKHVARRDQWVTPERAEEIKDKVHAHQGSMRLELYDADHAFMNDTRPEVHAAEAAKLAWDRTIAFFHEYLG